MCHGRLCKRLFRDPLERLFVFLFVINCDDQMIKLLEQVNVKLDNLVVKSEHLEHFAKLGLLLAIRHLLQVLV